MMSLHKVLMTTAWAAAFVAVGAASAHAVDLAAHRAVYSVTPGVTRDGNPNTVTGSIAYSVEKVCGGWLMVQNSATHVELPDGGLITQRMLYSSWESDSGDAYRFTATVDGSNQDVVLGSAEITPGQGGQAIFRRPEAATFDLPVDTMFPVTHTRFIIEGARAGQTQLQSHIFEGAEVGGAMLLVAFVSPLSQTGREILAQLGGDFAQRKGWNFRLAYFDPADQSGQPAYEVDVDLLDNGIAPRWVWDYGTHSVDIRATKIEMVAKPDC